MTEAVKPIPEGYHTVTPYFTVADAGGFLNFLKLVFDAEETERIADSDGRTRHAEARIGNSKVMIGQATEQWRGKPNAVYVYVADVDATYHKALAAGAHTSASPPRTSTAIEAEGSRMPTATHGGSPAGWRT